MPRGLGRGVVRLQEDRAKRRAQGQRDETGDHRRGGDGGRELREEAARDARDEGCREENGAQRQCDRDQRPGHLVHRVMRRLARRHAERHVALDVLDHDDGVVDHDAHGQHETKQRQIVDRDAERGENRKSADQRYRDSDHRDDRRPPALQKQVDDADHEEDRDADRHDHFVDGLAHEGGRVIDVDVVETGREALLELRHFVPHLVLHLDDIRARSGDHPKGRGRIAIRVGDRAVVHRAQFDAADVANARDAPLGIRLHDDVAELLGGGETPKRADVDLVGPARVVEDRRLVESSGRDLGVLGAQDIEDVAGADIARGSLVRIDPDPHGVLPLTQDPEIGNAGKPRDLVSDVENEVVGDVLGAAGSIRGIGMDAQQEGRDRLPDLHALELDFLRQPGQRVLHPVVRQHERCVDVGADLEDHRDVELAITRRLAGDVIHVLDAIDGLLERRRHGASDDVGRSAGVGGRDLDRWRDDVRVLRDRQERRRGQTEHHDEDIDHRGEPRVVNEEVREFHGSPQLRL